MLVTESLVLAAAAGAISAYLTLHVPKPLFHLVASRAADFPMPPDWRTFSYIAVVVLVTGVLAGLAPALESLRVDLTSSLKGGRNVLFGSPGGTGMRGFLVSAQVALSMVLLVEAGLFVRSEDRALRANPGYAPQRVVLAWLRFPDKSTVPTTKARLRAIEQRMMAVPGVRSVAFSDRPPLMRPETIELSPPARKDASQPVDIYTASPGFFETLGIALLNGREFTESDGPSVIVSQSLAKAFWRNRNPIGQILELPSGSAQVVGVAKDIEPMRIGGSDNPPLYQLRKVDAFNNIMSVRFDRGVGAGVRSVREALRQVEPDLVAWPMLLQAWIDRVKADLWNLVALMAVLGGVGTILATTGIYGAVSFTVNQKMRDLGIRMALGASRWDIVREVFLFGGRPVTRGLVVGLWMSMATASGLHENFTDSIIRLDSSEPLLYGSAMLFLAIGAAAAMCGPARRGATADPLETLRCD
jgi:predicted permease